MERYRVILFIFLLAMYYPMIYFLDSRPLLSAVFFIGAVIGAWAIEKVYSRKVELVVDERLELIRIKSVYYGSLAFLVGLTFELIWLAGSDWDTLVMLSKLLLLPGMLMVIITLGAFEYYQRVM